MFESLFWTGSVEIMAKTLHWVRIINITLAGMQLIILTQKAIVSIRVEFLWKLVWVQVSFISVFKVWTKINIVINKPTVKVVFSLWKSAFPVIQAIKTVKLPIWQLLLYIQNGMYRKFSAISAALGNSATIINLPNDYWGNSPTPDSSKDTFRQSRPPSKFHWYKKKH